MLDRRLDVVRLEGHVVKALAARVEELREEALAERLEQLDLAAARKAQLEPAPGVPRVAAHQVLAAEPVAIEPQRGLDRVQGDGDVVEPELRHRRARYAASEGSGPTFTSIFPKFSPPQEPDECGGAFSMPSITVSRYLTLPSRDPRRPSPRRTSGMRSKWSLMMNPFDREAVDQRSGRRCSARAAARSRCTARSCRRAATRPNRFMRASAASRCSPPTFSKYTSMPSGQASLQRLRDVDRPCS